MVGFGFKPRQLGLSGSQHRAANPCAGRPLSHYRPLLQSVWAPHVMEGEHITVRIFCVLWVSFVSVSMTGDMVSVWLVLREHLVDACVSESFQRTWLPSLICQLSTGSLPSRECFLPSSCLSHTSPFFPLLSARWPTLVPVTLFIPLLRDLRSLFSLAVEHVHLGSPHFLLLYLYP